MSRETIGISIAAAVLIIDLITDYRLWLKYRNDVKPEGSVKHKYGAVLRAAGLIPSLILAGWFLSPLILFLYWELFSGIYNLLTGQKWNRLGETAWSDKLMRKYPVIVTLKYIGLVLSAIWYALSFAFNYFTL